MRPFVQVTKMKTLNDELREQIRQLRQWVADLQSGMYVNCVYCGHRYGPADSVPATMADALKQHIATCDKHPMAKFVKASIAAEYVICSLLAVRDGTTDELLIDVRDALRDAIETSGTVQSPHWKRGE